MTTETTATTLQNIEDAITALKDGWASTALNILEEARLNEMAKEQLIQAGIYPPGTQEPVTILPDGSAFGVMSFPLPDHHWLYAPNEYRDGEYESIDLPRPILTHALREAVVAAVRYAVRGATMRGQEMDFDPDALVQNAVYALCGPYTTPPAAQRQWVGLTGQEYSEAEKAVWAVVSFDDTEKEANLAFYRAIEAKLKEKNG